MRRKYAPSQDLLTAVRNLFPMEICPWDDYYPRMAQTDFLDKREGLNCSKTYFYRKAPFGGVYCHLAGLTAFLRTLADYRFDDPIVHEALLDMGYKKEFVDFLNDQSIVKVRVHALPEGSILLPNEPGIILEGPLWAVRIAEGIMLKHVNFPTLSMTKWSRCVQAAAPGHLMEFARRRAQDDLRTTLYAYLAGAAVTSNAEVRRGADIKVVGTMGHEYVQSFGDEYEAFDTWLTHNPDRPVLLVDTIDTLNSGVPNAIGALKKHLYRIKDVGGVPGIRNDSGDLAYITLEERTMLDAAGLEDALIYETNELDEHSIESMKQQIFTHAPRAGQSAERTLSQIVWACGTQPGVCADQPSLGGVAKLTSVQKIMHSTSEEVAVIKLARDNPIKTSIPGNNRSYWIVDEDSKELICCLIAGKHEEAEQLNAAYHPDDESKIKVLYGRNIRRVLKQQLVYDYSLPNPICEVARPSLIEVRNRVGTQRLSLHWTSRRLHNPHTVKVSLSKDLFTIRREMILGGKLMNI